MKENGVNIYELPEAERARWAKVLSDARVAAKTIANCKKATGYPAFEVADFFTHTLTESGYKFPYPQVLQLK
jgi:hypothetical protein